MKDLVCSPGKKNNKFTCYSHSSLLHLRNLWNYRHPDVPINSENDREIWLQLKSFLQDVCNNEQCWLDQQFSKNKLTVDIIDYTFAPIAPKKWIKNKNEWLTSIDIEKVMQQYEKEFPNFLFLGPSPIDFDKVIEGECIWEEICKFNVTNILKNKKNKIGLIFNIDPHYKNGSHWVSVFIDLKNQYIIYFDSVADKIPKEIDIFINRVIEQCKYHNIKLKKVIIDKEHQKGDTECGMYCLYFIITLLTKNDYNQFINNRIPDINMENLREVLFNHPKNL